jgi:hypothetical protein
METTGPEVKEEHGVEDVLRIRQVHEEQHYTVWIVKFDDMPAMTYGVVNKDTDVIENLQPILYNAKTLAKQFSAWLEGENPSEEALRLMSTGPAMN